MIVFSRCYSLLKKFAMLGCSPNEREASNRITVFTNLMVMFAVIMGVLLCLQLPYFGIPLKYIWTMVIFTSVGGTVLKLNSKGKLFAARLMTLILSALVGWNAIIIFGKTFNGYYILFVTVLYSVVAFSREPVGTRSIIVFLSALNLPLMDWMFHSRIDSISGLDSRDFPFSVLWVETCLYVGLIIIIAWVEKARADRYEDDLTETLNVVQQEKQKIEIIFNSVNQGIVVLNKNLDILTQYSAKTESIFPNQKVVGQKIVNLLFDESDLSEDEKAQVKTSLEFSVGEDVINWEMNKGHLPKEISSQQQGQKKFFALSWSPVVQDDLVRQVVLTIEDITANKNAEAEKIKQQFLEANKQLVFSIFSKVGREHCKEFVEAMYSVANQFVKFNWRENTGAIKKELHTLKGEARLLQLTDLSDQIHKVEDAVKADSLPESIQLVSSFIEKAMSLKEAQEELFRNFKDADEDSWNLYNYIYHLKNKIETQVSQSSIGVQAIHFSDGVHDWPKQYRKPVQAMLLHCFQNSVDHGYLIPKLKRDIELSVVAKESSSEYFINVKDCGAGLNMEVIHQKFNELPNDVKAHLNSPTEILFLESISTSDKVTQTSGRGVGLSAVHAEVLRLGGQISIENRSDGIGATIQISLPKVSQVQQVA